MVKVLVPPVSEPVSLADFKAWMRNIPIPADQENMVNSLLKAGREESEKYQNTAYFEQTLQIALDEKTLSAIVLPRPPFKSLESVICFDVNDAQTDITDLFAVNDIAFPAEIKMKDGQDWPNITYRSQNPVVITYKAGSSDVPEKVKQAILLYATWFYMRPDAEKVTDAFYALLKTGRVIPV